MGENKITFEMLGSGLKLVINNEHRFGTDAFLLYDFAVKRKNIKVCDFCSGCGIIGTLMFRDEYRPAEVYCVEIQSDAADLIARTAEENSLTGKLIPVNADLRSLKGTVVPRGEIDLITCNPPFKRVGHGLLSQNEASVLARHEVECTISDVCNAAAPLLKFNGSLCICQRPERLADIITEMRKVKIEPKRIRFVQKRIDTKPWLVLVEGKRGARPFMEVLPPLLIQNDAGDMSDELKRIYKMEEKS